MHNFPAEIATEPTPATPEGRLAGEWADFVPAVEPVRIELKGGGFALVDAADEAVVRAYRWRLALRANGLRYAVARGAGGATLYMHRLILGLKDRFDYCDHANGDGLDNRRANIRRCTARQNNVNKASTNALGRGVDQRPSGAFRAKIAVRGVAIHLGQYATREEAAAAHRAANIVLNGEFAPLDEQP